MQNVTAIVKTFLRDECLFKCVASIREQYPLMKIIVVDDGNTTEKKKAFCKKHDAKYLTMSFDSGLPAGRNLALEHVDTEYVLIGDDDFIYRNEDVRKLERMMDICDIAGGRVVESGEVKNYQGTYRENNDGKELQWVAADIEECGEHLEVRFRPCNFTFNFFLGRTAQIREVLWDDQIKVAYEHSDFFISAWKKGLRVVCCPDVLVEHDRSFEPTEKYKEHRFRRSDREYFLKKWGYTTYRDIRDVVDSLDPSLMTDFQSKAPDVMLAALRALEAAELDFWAQDGTLLGLIREGGFIAHDHDIDFGVRGGLKWQVIACFYRQGFHEVHEFGTPENGYELSFEKNGVKVDLFWHYNKGMRSVHSAWWKKPGEETLRQLNYDYPYKIFTNLKKKKFREMIVPIPNDPELFLTIKYGDWKQVKEEWDWAHGPLNVSEVDN